MTTDFRTLNVWQEAHTFTLEAYKIVSDFPNEERYNLVSQLKRAATSIELNISEGCGRRTDKEFVSFLYQALGSCKEVENILLLTKDLNLIKSTDFERLDNLINKIGKMLSGLIKSRQETNTHTPKPNT